MNRWRFLPLAALSQDQLVSVAGSVLVHGLLLLVLSLIMLPQIISSAPAGLGLEGTVIDSRVAAADVEVAIGMLGDGTGGEAGGSTSGPRLSEAVIPVSGGAALNVHAAALDRIDYPARAPGGLNAMFAPGIGGEGNGRGTGSGNAEGAGTGGGEFFGIQSSKRRMMFVVDCSRSMNAPHPGVGRTRFGRVKMELLRTIGAMQSTQQFYMIFFADGVVSMPAQRMMEATPDSKNRYLTWMANLIADGGTEPEASLLLALSLQPDVIYFLTDGRFDPSVVRKVTLANRSGIPINTIGFGDDVGEKPLRDIAERNNGTYKFIPADELQTDQQSPVAATIPPGQPDPQP